MAIHGLAVKSFVWRIPSRSSRPFAQLPALEAAAEILDRARDSLLEIDPRLPAQDFSGAPDVGLAHFRVVLRQRFVFDLRFRPGDANDLFRGLLDPHLARRGAVPRLVALR